MPEGITRDHKQNPSVKQWGVLYSSEGGYLTYDKHPNNEFKFIKFS